MLPPVSVPSAPSINPAATPLPEPEEDPPVHRSVFQGLRGTGNGLVLSGMPTANSMVVSLPITIAPAARRRLSTGPSPWSPQDGGSTRD